MTRSQRRGVGGGEGWGVRESVEEVAPLKLTPETNCSYKFVRIRSHSGVREIWPDPKSSQLAELTLYRSLFSLHHSHLLGRASEPRVRKFAVPGIGRALFAKKQHWKSEIRPSTNIRESSEL